MTKTNKNIDESYFQRTAAKAKAINIGARVYRGGTRL